MSNPEFPALLYKAGGTMLLWDGEMFDHVVVNDEDELKAAQADGYSIGKPEAPKAKAPKAKAPKAKAPKAKAPKAKAAKADKA